MNYVNYFYFCFAYLFLHFFAALSVTVLVRTAPKSALVCVWWCVLVCAFCGLWH